ncbi:MAG: sigma 54-interacting transcriptional regulator [Candidatus Cloacimonadales bacterium]|nr:sigma 54-interacting transcriptional regulator [Candidatus Cloacimonadales bacterium]
MKKEYKKLQEIGKGAFATVWLAHDAEGNQVVLKEYITGSIAEARREYLFLKALYSPNIVKAIEFQEDPPLLVQEHVSGDQMKPEKLKTKKQQNFFLAKLAAILAHMHSAGICYNDLKSENIILRDHQPVLIDLGLATPNRFNDNIFRGTPAYSAPEKIKRNENTFAADVFAFGLLAFQMINGKLPADLMPYEEYKILLSNPEKWQNYLDSASSDDNLKSMLSLSPGQRPTMSRIAIDYAQKAGIPTSETIPDLIRQYSFECQQQASQQLLDEKKLICVSSDEPDRIIEHTALWLESTGKETLHLKESDYLWQPQLFFEQFKEQILSESELVEYLKTSEKNLLLNRDLINSKTNLFDMLSELPNSLVAVHSQKSSLKNATYQEITELHRQYEIKIDDFPSDYSGKPYLTRLQLLQGNGIIFDKKVPQEIVSLLAAIDLQLPVSLLESVWPDAVNLLPAIIAHPSIRIKEDGLYFIGDKSFKNPSKALLERVFKSAENLGFLAISSKTALLLDRPEKALEFLESYLNSLISQEYFASAYEVLQVYSSKMKLPVSLQKREAFLLRKNGYLNEALQKYEVIQLPSNSLEFAVIASDRAVILQELNRIDEARSIYEKILPIFEKQENKKAYLRTLNNIGVIHVQSDHFAEAEKTFLKMLEIAKQNEDKQFITMSHLNLADVYLRRGEWRKSLYQAQTAAEFGKKFKRKAIEVWAQIYGIQAQWSLGSVDNLGQVILQIIEDADLQEQIQLLENFTVNMLPIMLNLQTEKCDRLFSILNSSETDSAEKQVALFWYYSVKQNFLKATEILQKTSGDFVQIGRAYLAGNSEILVSAFRDLGLKNDCFGYLQTAVLVLQNQLFQESKELNVEISSFASLHPFHPLSTIKKESRNLPEMEHLNVLWNIISLIQNNESFDTTMQSILAGVIRIADLERAIYYIFDNGEMKPRFGLNRDTNPLDLENIRISRTILQETIKLGHIRYFESLQEETPFNIHSSIFGLGLRTAVCYPIIVNSEIRGVIYADATDAKDFTGQEQNLLEALFVQSRAALEKTEKIETLMREREQILESSESSFPEIIGNSKPMQKIFALMKTVGSHNVNILITGPTGSGKELIAKALHREYNARAPFIAVNCAAIPENLLESELFGYTKGAFTGAVKDTKGKIEAANGGTLFLDEIGDMPPALQAKLLRVLQDRMITPLGSTKEIPVSFRIITATNQNLKDLVKQNIFREDLYFRLNVVEIDLPSLSERKDDILPLAEFFLHKYNDKFGKQLKQISPRSARTLLQKEWRGNVRELENTMEKAVLLSPGEELETSALDIESNEFNWSSGSELPLVWLEYREYRRKIIHQLDKRYTDQLLEKTSGNINRASTVGKIPRPQIYRILKDE